MFLILFMCLCVYDKTVNVHVFKHPAAQENGKGIKNIKGKKGSNEFRGKWTLMVLTLLMFHVTNYWKFDKHTKLSPHAGQECAEVLSTC